MNIASLKAFLEQFEGSSPVVLQNRIKTGYDQGEIYEASDIRLDYRSGRLVISPLASKLVGGW